MPAPRLVLSVLLALAAAVLVACGDEADETTTSTQAQGECTEREPPPVKDQTFKKPARVLEPGQPATATVATSCGTFVIELDTKRSPQTTNSFAFLAEQGFYDDTVVHRIVPGAIFQAGDPKGSDPELASTGGAGYQVREPPPARAEYTRGVVAMAKTSIDPPGTSDSQFFVVTAPADAGFPPDYAILGTVRNGMDVVSAIGELGDPATERPLQTVVVDEVTIQQG